MDIWDTFGKEAKSQKSSEVTCFFVGSQSSGKSSLISRFLDQAGQGSNKPTIGLEYIYAKKGSVLCNIWEAGGNLDSNLVKMIQVSRNLINADDIYLYLAGTDEKCDEKSKSCFLSCPGFEFAEYFGFNMLEFSEVS